MAQAPSRLSAVLYFDKQLKLNTSQVDQFNQQISHLKVLKTTLKPDSNKFINDQLTSILNADQYRSYITFYRQTRSTYLAKLDWGKLKKYGLAKGLDSMKVKNELYKYEFKKATELESLTASQSKEEIDALKKKVAKMRPAYLNKMDVYNTAFIWGQKNWQILKQFHLTQGLDSTRVTDELYHYELKKATELSSLGASQNKEQIDSTKAKLDRMRPSILQKMDLYKAGMIWTNKNWQLLKNFGLNKGVDSAIVNQQNLEYEVKKAITFKNIPNSEVPVIVKRPAILLQLDVSRNTKRKWELIQKYGLATGLDSIKIKQEIQNYEQKRVVTIEQYSISLSEKDALARNELEENKPQVLKDLDRAVQSAIKTEKF
ncbi:hypothetical protein [Mucilaginibacter sp.]|uniref:hypothetical protein n=1 Tax=Mucilaginibacter sp. TaxID=1882438 RepID=UPI0032676E9A